jgi:hypothetical protein
MNHTALSWGDPTDWVYFSPDTLFDLDVTRLENLQRNAANNRLFALRETIPALKRLAGQQNLTELNELNDLAALLFTHEVYKSYPMALIEKGKFDQLTVWLNTLTTHDLSGLDMSGITTIDAWLDALDQAGMFIFHSTGTTGKLSFFPRSQTEFPAWAEGNWVFMASMIPGIRSLKLPVFWPAFRGGRQAGMRLIAHFGPLLAGDADEYHSMFDTPMSADLMSIAGRLRRAQEAGDLKALDTIKAIIRTKGEIVRLKTQREKLTRDFFEKMMSGYKGQRVFLMAAATDLLDIAQEGLRNGAAHVFAKDSVFLTGGGFKGREVIDHWKEVLSEFYGVETIHMTYGMTELNTYNPGCRLGHYHVLPWNIIFVLDEQGNPLPRQGTQTGRAGYFDLLAQSYWGGILTGDRVTVHFDDCECGWQGPHIEDNVQRMSAYLGGEDIISCAGVQAAHDEMLDFSDLAV